MADKIIEKEKPDKVIFLGDFFDQWNDCPLWNEQTAMWVKEKMEKHPDWEWIFGNHDLAYAYPKNSYTSCSGFTESKAKFINIHMEKAWGRFKFFSTLKGQAGDIQWLLSHGGLHKKHIPDSLQPKEGENINKPKLVNYLLEESIRATAALVKYRSHWMYAAGRGRGGPSPVGGLTWLDWNREFAPITGLNQLVGHTEFRFFGTQEIKIGTQSTNWCIDSTSQLYCVYENDNLEVKTLDLDLYEYHNTYGSDY